MTRHRVGSERNYGSTVVSGVFICIHRPSTLCRPASDTIAKLKNIYVLITHVFIYLLVSIICLFILSFMLSFLHFFLLTSLSLMSLEHCICDGFLFVVILYYFPSASAFVYLRFAHFCFLMIFIFSPTFLTLARTWECPFSHYNLLLQ
jgi:hypothetical protein